MASNSTSNFISHIERQLPRNTPLRFTDETNKYKLKSTAPKSLFATFKEGFDSYFGPFPRRRIVDLTTEHGSSAENHEYIPVINISVKPELLHRNSTSNRSANSAQRCVAPTPSESPDTPPSSLTPVLPVNEIANAAIQPDGYDSKFLKEFDVKKIRGEGAFGVVLEAVHKIDHGVYAVKRIAVKPGEMETDLREVRAMAKLDHPGIVRYNSMWIEQPPGGWQAFIYIQMQLCNHSLADWLKNNQTEDSRNILRMKSWFKQVVNAVDYIHENNFIHRDLKPSNILFADQDHLKVCDLGIVAEIANEDTTITRTRRGTPVYMSPEQRGTVEKARFSSKSDVFTLGLILVELCVVMTSTERNETFDSFRCGNQSNRIQDARAAEFVRKLTQVDPKDRPSCREMLDDLFLA